MLKVTANMRQEMVRPPARRLVSDVVRPVFPTKLVAKPHAARHRALLLKSKVFAVGGVLLVATSIVLAVIIRMAPWAQRSGIGALAETEQAVARHYILPSGEVPALATVEDQSKLSTPFLKQAHNGDKILIYTDAKVAIIYRPSVDRIVAVGPVTVSPPPSDATN